MRVVPAADRTTVFVEAGTVATRRPDGSFDEPMTLFIAVPAEEATPQGLLYQHEREQIEDIAGVLAKKYAAYIDGIRAIERHQRNERRKK